MIGVVGSTIKSTFNAAEWVGGAITELGAILVTGGAPDPSPSAVKDFTIRGASKRATTTCSARIIGILPESGARYNKTTAPATHLPVSFPRLSIPSVAFPPLGFCVQTPLGSWERDVLTGGLPDVLIACDGRTGTLAEVAFAAVFGVPIFFVDSTEELKKARSTVDETIRAGLTFFAGHQRLPHIDAVLDALDGAMQAAPSRTLSIPDATAATAALQHHVLPAIPSSAFTIPSRFPDFPNDTAAKGEFDEKLASL